MLLHCSAPRPKYPRSTRPENNKGRNSSKSRFFVVERSEGSKKFLDRVGCLRLVPIVRIFYDAENTLRGFRQNGVHVVFPLAQVGEELPQVAFANFDERTGKFHKAVKFRFIKTGAGQIRFSDATISVKNSIGIPHPEISKA